MTSETFEAVLPTGLDPATLGTLDATAAFRVALSPPTGGPDVTGAGASAAFDLGPYRLRSMSLSAVDARALAGLAVVAGALAETGHAGAEVALTRPTLEDAFLTLTGRDLRVEGA